MVNRLVIAAAAIGSVAIGRTLLAQSGAVTNSAAQEPSCFN